MKAKIVKAKVEGQKVNCRLEPGFLRLSMCTDKLLKRIGGKISRKLTLEEKDSKFVREETTAPLGVSLGLTDSERINLLNTKIVKAKVEGQKVNCRLEPGFLRLSMCTDKLLKRIGGKISRKLTLEEKDKDAWVRTTLHIKNFAEKKRRKVIVCVTKNNVDEFYEFVSFNSDSDTSDTSSSSISNSESDNKHVCKAVIRPKRCYKKNKSAYPSAIFIFFSAGLEGCASKSETDSSDLENGETSNSNLTEASNNNLTVINNNGNNSDNANNKRKASIYQFFTLNKEENRYYCNHCVKSYKAAKDSSTSTLRNHISREHKNLNPEISTSGPLDKFFKSKTALASSENNLSEENWIEDLINWIVADDQSFIVVDKESFKILMKLMKIIKLCKFFY
ncbi:hypothetical protein Glove_117g278 [Diversispora epigaea]|uniref:BED-type domain-containing protein n=1 Tax=Diversispora epigaea TaxID=1348612 RepID=A0A397J9G5_9GLOM|nr:hypothetical protein Glove_117g278 [Diversispora epigaea]